LRIILIAGIMAVVGAVGASVFLNDRLQEPVYRAFATDGARVGNPGDNLVGRDWRDVPRS
jgi:hypothetical protein